MDATVARSARAIKCPPQDKAFASDPKKASNGLPMKMLIREEMTKEKETKRNSPSIVARLMGLDFLPTPPPIAKQIKVSEKRVQKSSCAFLKENSSSEHNYVKLNSPEQEFKDVFEVFETPKVEKCKDPAVRKRSQKLKRSNKDIDFIRQKFMEAKRLSTDEKLRHSKEFGDALEVLDSNKDIFLKFLQEPNSLLVKHYHDPNSSPRSGHITILKSTKPTSLEDGEIRWKSCGGDLRSNEYELDVAKLRPKCQSDSYKGSVIKHSGYLFSKLEDTNFESDLESCTVPTRIVVLKPCLEKVLGADEVLTSSDPLPGYRRHKECISRSNELSFENESSREMQNNINSLRHKTKSQREKTREPEKGVKNVERGNRVSTLNFGHSEFLQIDNLDTRPGKGTVVEIEAMEYNSGYSYRRERRHPSSSSSQSDKYLVSKQARKHLSKQWLVSQNSHEDVEPASSSMSTLGEMLAFSDKETHDCGSTSRFNQKGGNSPSVTSTDRQRHVCSRKLPRSRSLPTSSTVCKSLLAKDNVGVCSNEDSLSLGDVLDLARMSSDVGDNCPSLSLHKTSTKDVGNKSLSVDSTREQIQLHICEPSKRADEQWSRTVTVENSCEVSELSSARFFDAVASDNDTPPSESEDGETTSTLELDMLPHAIAVEATDVNCCTNDDLHLSQKSSPSSSQVELSCSQSSSGYVELCTASKEAEQTSPVSVLEPPEDEEISSLDCFERVNADLQGLRIQLQRLKLERASGYSEGSEYFCDDETYHVPDVSSPLHVEQIPLTCDDEEDRGVSYLNGILSGSGITGATMETVLDACYSQEFPLDPSVFEKHEKVYADPTTWPRSERKLLFDLTNLYLKDKLEPHMDQRLWLQQPIQRVGLLNGKEVIPEEVWSSLAGLKEWVGHPMESAVDIKWLDTRDDIDSIGKDLEKLLRDELLDELIQELVSK